MSRMTVPLGFIDYATKERDEFTFSLFLWSFLALFVLLFTFTIDRKLL